MLAVLWEFWAAEPREEWGREIEKPLPATPPSSSSSVFKPPATQASRCSKFCGRMSENHLVEYSRALPPSSFRPIFSRHMCMALYYIVACGYSGLSSLPPLRTSICEETVLSLVAALMQTFNRRQNLPIHTAPERPIWLVFTTG